MRRPFKRDVDVPAAVVARAGLGRGEKVLTGALTTDGTWLLGTRAALVVVSPEVEPAPEVEPFETLAPLAPQEPLGATSAPVETLPWERVERADWDRDNGRLRVSEVGVYGQRRPVHVFGIDDPGLLLALVRERVTASVVLQRRVTVAGKKGFFVVGRRPPTGVGDVAFAYEFDAGVDPDDPEVRRLAEAGLQAAAEELGLGLGPI